MSERPLHIGMIVDTEFNSDPRVRNEAKLLAEAGMKVSVLCMNFGKYSNEEVVDGINVERIEITRAKKNRLFGLMNTLPGYTRLWRSRIKQFIAEKNFAAVHVHDLHMMEPAMQAVDKKFPLILDLHENLPAVFETAFTWANKIPKKWLVRPKQWRRKEQKLLEAATKIIVLDETYADKLIKNYPSMEKEKFVAYPNVPDVEVLTSYEVKEVPEIAAEDFTLFYFGVIGERRGVFDVMNCLPELQKLIPNIKLLLIGPCDNADQDKFQALLHQPNISKCVIYHDWKPIEDFPSYCVASDVGISPIRKDEQHESGIANKVFQYMLFKKPVLVSDCAPQERLVNQHNCGMVYEWGNKDSFINQVVALHSDKTNRTHMGMNGEKAVLAVYNTNVMGKRLVDMYASIQQ